MPAPLVAACNSINFLKRPCLLGGIVPSGSTNLELARAPQQSMRRAGSQQRAGDRKMSDGRLNRLKSGAIDETKKLFGIFLYFWILLSLFSLHKALVLNDDSLVYHQGFAVINALALAKVVLLGEMFHAGDRLKGKPLIYPIVFKSAVFGVLLILFHLLEEAL